MNVQIYGDETGFNRIFEKHRFRFALLEFYDIAEYYLPRIRILQSDCFIIVDRVDVHFLREKLRFNLTQDPEHFKESEETKKRELAVYNKADMVWVVTEEDGNVLKKENNRIPVEVVPNIHNPVKRNISGKDKNTLIFVGSFSHGPNVDAIEYFCSDVMPLLIQALPEIQLKIIGSKAPDRLKRFSCKNVEFLGFVPSLTSHYHHNYISVAPSRYGAGMKGKIGEAMAHGLPVITTPIGNQGMNLVHRHNVLIANTPEEYVQRIMDIISDENLYKKISDNAINFIEDHYSEGVVGKEIYKICASVKAKPIKRFNGYKRIAFFLNYVVQRLKGVTN